MTLDAADTITTVIVPTGGGRTTPSRRPASRAARGTPGNETIDCGGANPAKTINGGAGNDTLTGTAFVDLINGDTGGDTLTGGVGNDTLNGGDGDDTMTGSAGDDALNGDGGNDTVNGGDGNDTLNGGGGTDILRGDAGNDSLTGPPTDVSVDSLTGGADPTAARGPDRTVTSSSPATPSGSRSRNVDARTETGREAT